MVSQNSASNVAHAGLKETFRCATILTQTSGDIFSHNSPAALESCLNILKMRKDMQCTLLLIIKNWEVFPLSLFEGDVISRGRFRLFLTQVS